MFIDLRSDTVTKPTLEMINAMQLNLLGDELYGDDISTLNLENYCAKLFEKDAALFLPSGMMANLVSIMSYTEPGDTVLTHEDYYINYFQSQPIISLCKINISTFSSKGINEPFINNSYIIKKILKHSTHALTSTPKVIWVENTINAISGKVYPIQEMKKLYMQAKDSMVGLHVDGARILNACVAQKISPAECAKYCDSLSLSFSKGLGAPFGAILVGDNKFIEKAKQKKKALGGGMHQSGVMAGMCLYALENNICFLEKDHLKARQIANILSHEPELLINLDDIETNIVMFKTNKLKISATEFCNILLHNNIKAYPWNNHIVRLVTHKDVSSEQVCYASEQILKISQELLRK